MKAPSLKISVILRLSIIGFLGAFQTQATDRHLNDFLERASSIDRAWVSPVPGDSSAKEGIDAYNDYFAGAVMTPIDLESVSRRGRVVLFCHILNTNITKIRDGLADGDELPGASTADTRLPAGSVMHDYFIVGPDNSTIGGRNYSYAYWSKKPAKFTYGGLEFELEAHPHRKQHGDCELKVTSGFTDSTAYASLSAWDTDPDQRALVFEQLTRGAPEAYVDDAGIPNTGLQHRINIMRLLCELEIARRYVNCPSTVVGSKDVECGTLPFVTLLTMAKKPKDLIDSYFNSVEDRRQNMRDLLTCTLFEDALLSATRRKNLLLVSKKGVGVKTHARTRFLTDLVRGKLQGVLAAGSDSEDKAAAAMEAGTTAAVG